MDTPPTTRTISNRRATRAPPVGGQLDFFSGDHVSVPPGGAAARLPVRPRVRGRPLRCRVGLALALPARPWPTRRVGADDRCGYGRELGGSSAPGPPEWEHGRAACAVTSRGPRAGAVGKGMGWSRPYRSSNGAVLPSTGPDTTPDWLGSPRGVPAKPGWAPRHLHCRSRPPNRSCHSYLYHSFVATLNRRCRHGRKAVPGAEIIPGARSRASTVGTDSSVPG